MKILLINPPNSGRSIPEEQYGIETIKMIFRGEPLALEVLAGNLIEHDVCIVDLKVEPDRLEAEIESFRPELVGITGVTCEANAVLKIAEICKAHSDPIVVVGGHHASGDPEYFNRSFVDYIAVGLGKASFRQLVEHIERNESSAVPGIAKTMPGHKLNFTHRQFTDGDLADDQPPRYDLVSRYRDNYIMSGVGGKMGFVVTAFGCTHKCSFCSIPNITGGKYLTHSIQAVLRDIGLLGDLPVIRLVDANTFGNPALSETLATKILESGLCKGIIADVRADTVVKQPELFRLWKSAGLNTVVIGFEEITDERLSAFQKRSTLETHIAALDQLSRIGIRVIGDFIISPDYVEKDFKALETFVANHPIALAIPAILTPIPGTPLYEQLNHRITIHDLDYYTFSNAVLPTRMDQKSFYQTYANLLNSFLGHIRH